MRLLRRLTDRFLRAAALLLLAAASAVDVRAQGSDFITPFTNVFGTFGSFKLDVSKLNPRFERPDLKLLTPPRVTGFDAQSGNAVEYGVGGYAPVGRLLLGGEYQYGEGGVETSPQGKTDHLESNMIMASVGYAVMSGWNFTFFPYFGIGAGKLTLTLKNRDGGPTVSSAQNPTFDEVVFSPGMSSVLSGQYVIVQPGLGLDYLLLQDKKSQRGFTLGLRFSTSIKPHRTTWTYQGREVFGGPDAGPLGTSIRLVFGIGGFRFAK